MEAGSESRFPQAAILGEVTRMSVARRVQVVGGLAVVLLAASALTLSAQSRSDTMTVSVTVVRPCQVSTPSVLTGRDQVTVSCGRGAQSTSLSALSTPAVLRVPGAPAAPALTPTVTAQGLVLSVEF
jgi:hypothetical protein